MFLPRVTAATDSPPGANLAITRATRTERAKRLHVYPIRQEREEEYGGVLAVERRGLPNNCVNPVESEARRQDGGARGPVMGRRWPGAVQ